ncbi:hypothetical protein N7468_007220 [Penicillium chermesinum]|uniref:Uncharacterized protein n=1 Tax=Penicillium chermesinum TaxID=63820 RepID=A0A9W9TLZ0_9EURO|nr:uncharacterized protein N7468_007220 [Penicillium chermesinum]KAJ5225995.1 hypothetical protein N7468_007220 [Penicillium chermesinum]
MGVSFDLALVIVLGIITVHQCKYFSWQVRFAQLQWRSLTTAFEGALGGTTATSALFVMAISPLPFTTILVGLMIAWQYVLVNYYQMIRATTATGDEVYYEAKLAYKTASDHAAIVTETTKSILPIIKAITDDQEEYFDHILNLPLPSIATFHGNLKHINEIASVLAGPNLDMVELIKEGGRAHEKTKWRVEKAKLLAKHGEKAEAEAMLHQANEDLEAIRHLETKLSAVLSKVRLLDAKFTFENTVEVHKQMLREFRKYSEGIFADSPAPAAAPAPLASQMEPPVPQPEPTEPPQPVLPNSLTLTNPIALAGSLSGAAETIDDVAFELSLPFPVKIYGHESSVLSINDNGMICLDHGPDDVQNRRLGTQLPALNGIPPYTLFPLWEDLMIKKGKPHGIYYEIEGAEPNRKITIEYYVTRFQEENLYFHFLVILEEARPSVVTFKYFDVNDKGKLGTVGVQGSHGKY